MTSTLRRILVPLDGTPVSEQALGLVAPLLRGAAEVHLLRVVSTPGGRTDDAVRYLERTASALVACGARGVWPAVRRGDPVMGILEAAASIEPDLIAMATHGQGRPGERAYGSVVGQIVRRCPFPTVVMDPLRHRADGRGVRRILVPFDGSSAAASCLPLVALVARSYDAQVDLVHIGGPSDRGAGLEVHLRALEVAGVQAHGRVVAPGTRTVAARLVDEIERAEADLVIVSTGGREGVVRWTLGPIAEGVLRGCHRPILIRPVPGGVSRAQDAS